MLWLFLLLKRQWQWLRPARHLQPGALSDLLKALLTLCCSRSFWRLSSSSALKIRLPKLDNVITSAERPSAQDSESESLRMTAHSAGSPAYLIHRFNSSQLQDQFLRCAGCPLPRQTSSTRNPSRLGQLSPARVGFSAVRVPFPQPPSLFDLAYVPFGGHMSSHMQ